MINGMTLDPELLKAFVAVADHLSFSRAASSLNRSQSAVSMQIRRLEERIGAELFHRTKIHVELSPVGERLIDYARRILILNDEAVGKIREQQVDGSVRLGVMDDYGANVMPGLLASFIAAYPRIQIEMETGLTAPMPARLGVDFDLVVAMHPVGSGDGELLRREQAVWATGADRTIDIPEPVPLALSRQGCLFRKWAVDALEAAKRPWRLAFVSQNLGAIENMAALGLAVTVVKSEMVSPRLRVLTERDGMPPLPAADICLHRAARLTRAAKLLAEHLGEGISRPSGSLKAH